MPINDINPIEEIVENKEDIDNEQLEELDEDILEIGEDKNKNSTFDPREKIKIILNYIIQKSKDYARLGKMLTIDESIVAFKGRNKMKFFMPNKPTKWGFKIHCLVDSNTNYLYNLILDPGKHYKYLIKNEYNEKLTESIVLTLLKGLENTGRVIYFDSWNTSFSLC